MNKDLTVGNPSQVLWQFCLPMFGSIIFQQLYNIADSLVAGKFIGENALAAVGNSYEITLIFIAFAFGCNIGCSVIVSRYFGAKDYDEMKTSVYTSLIGSAVLCAVLTVVGVILTPQILHWMGTPEDVIGNSVAYFRTYFLGSIAVVMYNVGASILQSVGNSRSPMKYLITASLINIVLDLLFIGVLGYGVAAAAFATIISQSVSAILAFSKLMRSKEAWAVSWRKVRFDGPMLHGVILQGLPSGIQNSVISIANVIVQSNINSFGAQAMAGCGAYSKVEGFAFLPVTCFAMALATFVSQNVGAGQPDRVKKGMKFGCLCSVLMAVAAVLLMRVAAPWMVAFVSGSSEPIVLENGARYLLWNAPFYAVLGILLSTRYALQSLGQKVLPLFSSVIELVGKVIFVLVFIPRYAYNAVILCEPIIWCFMAAYLVAVYRRDAFVYPRKNQ